MDATDSLRWAAYYVALAALAAVVGIALVGAGLALGVGTAISQLSSGASPTAALGSAALGIVVALLGLLVWALGTAAAFVKVLTEAVESEMRDRFDSEKVKSEILSVMDDRLSDVEHDVQETRRTVSEMKRDDAAESFQFGTQE